MPAERPRAASSVFDELLERGRRELDALGGGTARASGQPRSIPAAAGDAPAQRAAPPGPARSHAERLLDEKLGQGWRCEVLERAREDGELIVRCRVTAPGGGVSRTQFGSAPFGGGVRGAVGETPFSVGRTEGRDGDERAAERAAVESALAACARLL